MTNQTELFHPECRRLALPAATTMVFVEGTLCGELEPIEIVRSGWPDFGYATLAYNPAAQQDAHVHTLRQRPADGRAAAEAALGLELGVADAVPLPSLAGIAAGLGDPTAGLTDDDYEHHHRTV